MLMALAAGLKLAFGKDEKGDAGPGGRGGPGGGRAQQVSEIVVAVRPFTDSIEVLGVAKGRESLVVTSSTTELITRVLFQDGQYVRQGQPLVELQAREEDAGIIAARATVTQARKDRDRWKTLSDKGIAPRVKYEQAQTALETAQAELRAAEARRGDRVIRAPFSGVVGLSDVTPGTLINPGAAIATLDDVSVMRVDFPVPERYLATLRPGMTIEATSDAFPGQTFAGRIVLLDSRIDERTRAITVRAEIPNGSSVIKPGMMMRVVIQRGLRTAAAAPEAAVQFEGDTAYAFKIVNQPGKGLVAQRTTVRRGANQDGFVEILEGLRPGDRIVASGLNRIQPNAPVKLGGGKGGRGGRPGAQTGSAPR
ncbi:MAG: efflux RND transporter periplasmic adaptor subunit [Caulobacteraceae bacterium]|nr:efflux RND transporter periplasmic adaptor subunit [Caulobacteraceae bacterium]